MTDTINRKFVLDTLVEFEPVPGDPAAVRFGRIVAFADETHPEAKDATGTGPLYVVNVGNVQSDMYRYVFAESELSYRPDYEERQLAAAAATAKEASFAAQWLREGEQAGDCGLCGETYLRGSGRIHLVALVKGKAQPVCTGCFHAEPAIIPGPWIDVMDSHKTIVDTLGGILTHHEYVRVMGRARTIAGMYAELGYLDGRDVDAANRYLRAEVWDFQKARAMAEGKAEVAALAAARPDEVAYLAEPQDVSRTAAF